MNVNVQEDLNAVNDQITKLVEELNKVTAAREQLVQQIQNMNGVAMYLRGKLPPQEENEGTTDGASMEDVMEADKKQKEEDLERSVEYPPDDK